MDAENSKEHNLRTASFNQPNVKQISHKNGLAVPPLINQFDFI